VHHRSTLVAHRLGHDAVEQAHMLQSTIGNQATLRLLAERARSLAGNERRDQCEQQAEGLAREAPVASWDFSKIPVVPPDRPNRPQASSPLAPLQLPGALQPKLADGRIDSPLEHEADRVADYVMRLPALRPSITAAPPELSRKCVACEEEPQTLRTKLAGPPEAAAGEASDIVHEVLRSPGQPLDAPNRASFESHFGRSFSDVRVHTGPREFPSMCQV
jgi:hypothetical protein